MKCIVYGYANNGIDNNKTNYSNNEINNDNNEINNSNDGYDISQYEFNDIDSEISQYMDYDISFKKIINTILENDDEGTDNYLKKIINNVVLKSIKSNNTIFVQIILLAIFSAIMGIILPDFQKGNINDTAQLIIMIMLITILTAMYLTVLKTASGTITACINIYKAVIPVFFSAVAFTTGKITTASYYQLIMIMITLSSVVLGGLFITLDKLYLFLSFINPLMEENRFSKLMELIEKIIKWTSKSMLIVFAGVGGIKGMINPLSDSVRKNIFFKSVSAIPGIGNSAETVTKTVMGTGTVIKNGIGSAAVIALCLVCIAPVIKLIITLLCVKLAAALAQPAAEKNFIEIVSSAGTAVSLLIIIVITVLCLFMMMTGIICLTTDSAFYSL